jgi:hypothetical protein
MPRDESNVVPAFVGEAPNKPPTEQLGNSVTGDSWGYADHAGLKRLEVQLNEKVNKSVDWYS